MAFRSNKQLTLLLSGEGFDIAEDGRLHLFGRLRIRGHAELLRATR